MGRSFLNNLDRKRSIYGRTFIVRHCCRHNLSFGSTITPFQFTLFRSLYEFILWKRRSSSLFLFQAVLTHLDSGSNRLRIIYLAKAVLLVQLPGLLTDEEVDEPESADEMTRFST